MKCWQSRDFGLKGKFYSTFNNRQCDKSVLQKSEYSFRFQMSKPGATVANKNSMRHKEEAVTGTRIKRELILLGHFETPGL